MGNRQTTHEIREEVQHGIREEDLLDQFLQGLVGQTVVFEAANLYGLSALGVTSIGQLHNTRRDDDVFRVQKVEAGVYAFEALSVPGFCIGVLDSATVSYFNASGYK
eukprot:gene31054-38949_t